MAFKWNAPSSWRGGKSTDTSASTAEKEVKPKVSSLEKSLASDTREIGKAMKAIQGAAKAIERLEKRAASKRAQIAEGKSKEMNTDLDKAFAEAERLIKEALEKNGVDASGIAGLEATLTLSNEERSGLEKSATKLRTEAQKQSSNGADLHRLLESLKAA
jgi:hypothetical protein